MKKLCSLKRVKQQSISSPTKLFPTKQKPRERSYFSDTDALDLLHTNNNSLNSLSI